MTNRFTFFFILFICFKMNSQNTRDTDIKEQILPFLNTENFYDISEYKRVKNLMKQMEIKYGYETDLQTRLLNASFYHNDIEYFKEQLSYLVEKFGYDIIYTAEKELYYLSITEGNLASWFKQMYIKNHSLWLEHNFEKLIDLYKLNQLNKKDQIISKFISKIYFSPSTNNEQKLTIQRELNNLNQEGIIELNSICKKINEYPNSKSFAVIQNGFQSILIHNFQQKETIDRTWEYLFPYIKKSYLKYNIDNTIFQNYDFYCYLNYGYQEFNSFKINEIPEQFRKSQNEIPLKNIEEFEKIKKEFKW